MSEVVKTAGLQEALVSSATYPSSPRRDAIKLIRATLRNQAASDEEVDDALDALIELSKD